MLIESNSKLNEVQLHLLKVFSKKLDEDSLLDIKVLLSDYFFNKVVNLADSEWERRNYSNQTMDEWIFAEPQSTSVGI